MLDKDPKKMASGVLARAFSGGGMVAKSNYKKPSAGNQPKPSMFGSPGNDSNYSMPEEDVQSYADGGEVEEGKLVAAEEALKAFEAKDAKGVASALQSFFDQCSSSSMDMDE